MSLQPWGESEVEFYAAQFLCIHMYTYMYVYLFKKKKPNRSMSYTEYSLLDTENGECEDLEYKGIYLYGGI